MNERPPLKDRAAATIEYARTMYLTSRGPFSEALGDLPPGSVGSGRAQEVARNVTGITRDRARDNFISAISQETRNERDAMKFYAEVRKQGGLTAVAAAMEKVGDRVDLFRGAPWNVNVVLQGLGLEGGRNFGVGGTGFPR